MKSRLILVGTVLAVVVAVMSWWGAGGSAAVRIGLVPFVAINERTAEGFKAALAERGYVEGRNVEYRMLAPEGRIDALPGRIEELLAWKPDLIYVGTTPASQAVAKATAKAAVPVVFAPVSDPVDAGLLTDLRRPGGNITGIRLAAVAGLRFEWLLRLAPGLKRVYVPYSSNDKSATVSLEPLKEAARAAGVALLLKPVRTAAEIEASARDIPAEAQAIFLPQDGRIESKIDLYARTAIERRLPLSAPSSVQVEGGALMSYGFEQRAMGRQGGRLAADILQGARPGDLPVETAESFLALNLITAQAIGLAIDDAALRQAHMVVR